MNPTELLRRVLRVAGSLPGRLVITVALLALVATQIEWGTLGETIEGASWATYAGAVAVIAASLAIGGVRWHALLHGAALRARIGQALRAYWIGAFANNLLPTGFGGDLVRAWYVAVPGLPLVRSVTSVLVDRFTALASSLLLAWVAVVVEPGSIPGSLVAVLVVGSGGCLAGIAIVVVAMRRGGLARFLPEMLRRWASEVASVLRAYGRDRALLARVLVLGLLYQAAVVAALWLIARAIHADAGLAVLTVITPLVLIATLAPVSIAGFGVREGAFVAMLAEVGVDAGDATLLSLLSVAGTAIASLPGGALLALGPEGTRIDSHAIEAGLAGDGPAPDPDPERAPLGPNRPLP